MKKQEQLFFDTVQKGTLDEHKEEMSVLLKEIKERKSAGQLDKYYLSGVTPRLFSYIDPNALAAVKKALEEYSD